VGFEVIVVDGGDGGPSTDRTVTIATEMGAKVMILREGSVVDKRNVGGRASLGDIVVFTDADTQPPPSWLRTIVSSFDPDAIAVAGPGIPLGGTSLVNLEYGAYNALRTIMSKLPRPFYHFSASTYDVGVRKSVFERIGGFQEYPGNEDGLFGRKLALFGKVKFCPEAYLYISARRFAGMGFMRANLHYAYVLENFLSLLAPVLRPLRLRSAVTFHKRLGISQRGNT
jgi:glycosyltransferase involved in cell wall biosynthesis